MTGLDRNQTPKTRPMAQKRTALVASLDVGTSKIACLIGRLKPRPTQDVLRLRTHSVDVIGFGHTKNHVDLGIGLVESPDPLLGPSRG